MSKKEKIDKYNAMLQKYLDNKEFVKIFRTICDKEDDLSGFILKISREFLLLQLDREFMFDGYAIIRQDDYDSIRCNKYDKTQKKIFKSEGLLDTSYGLDKNIDLTCWEDILQQLKKYDCHVIVESLNKDKDHLDFCIGPIIKVTKHTVSIHYYSPTGKLEKKPTKIKLDKIKTIKFGDRYSTIFRKYIKPQKSAIKPHK
jgi:hypothetical protein